MQALRQNQLTRASVKTNSTCLKHASVKTHHMFKMQAFRQITCFKTMQACEPEGSGEPQSQPSSTFWKRGPLYIPKAMNWKRTYRNQRVESEGLSTYGSECVESEGPFTHRNQELESCNHCQTQELESCNHCEAKERESYNHCAPSHHPWAPLINHHKVRFHIEFGTEWKALEEI